MGNGFLDDLPDLGLKPAKRRKKPATGGQKQPEPENVVVKYLRVKCPECKSYRVPVYNSEHLPIRYHKCKDCGFLFKSIEEKS